MSSGAQFQENVISRVMMVMVTVYQTVFLQLAPISNKGTQILVLVPKRVTSGPDFAPKSNNVLAKQAAQVVQDGQHQRNAKNGIDHRQDATTNRLTRYVAIAWKKINRYFYSLLKMDYLFCESTSVVYRPANI